MLLGPEEKWTRPGWFAHFPPRRSSAPRFSPDGRFIVYASNESGRFEIYVWPYPGSGRLALCPPSVEICTEKRTSANGNFLFSLAQTDGEPPADAGKPIYISASMDKH